MARQRWGNGTMAPIRDDIVRYWRELGEVLEAMPYDALARAAELLLDCQARGRVVFLVGNGGSAATA